MNWDMAEVRTDNQPIPQEPVRVLFVSHDTGMYGAQRTLMTLLSAIDRRVYSPFLVVPYDGPMRETAAKLGIPVFVVPLVHWVPYSIMSSRRQRLGHLYRFLRTLQPRCRAIERLIADHGIDLVYTNTVTCVEGAIAAHRTRKPHVWHIHEPLLRNRELALLLPYCLYCVAVEFLSKSIIFCSKALAMDYPQLSRKTSIVYNGLPLPALCDRFAGRRKLIKGLGINSDAKLVAVVGALSPRKDHLTFLAAAEQVSRRVEEVVFLIVGGSVSESYASLIRKRIRSLELDSKVRLLGWRDDIQDLLAAIDVLVISSEQESFGLTAIEALAMETPVVATRCGGPEEVMVDGVNGLLVPVKDPGVLADAIVRLLLDPNYARQLGVNGRNHVSRHFGVDRYVHGIQRVILESARLQRQS
jgi:glycosyltransferase involved in cell wall biosynthesis